MNQNRLNQNKWKIAYTLFLLFSILVMLFSQPSYTFWWWLTFISLSGAIILGITYLGCAYLTNHINGNTEE